MSQEKVYIVTETELEELIVNKQTEALRTIYTIAKSSPDASWNELVVRSAEQLQNSDSPLPEPAVVEELSEPVEVEETREEPVEEEAPAEPVAEEAFEDAEEAVSSDEDMTEEPAEQVADVEESFDATDEDEEDDSIFDEKTPTGVTPASSFRNSSGSSMIREASIFDD